MWPHYVARMVARAVKGLNLSHHSEVTYPVHEDRVYINPLTAAQLMELLQRKEGRVTVQGTVSAHDMWAPEAPFMVSLVNSH